MNCHTELDKKHEHSRQRQSQYEANETDSLNIVDARCSSRYPRPQVEFPATAVRMRSISWFREEDSCYDSVQLAFVSSRQYRYFGRTKIVGNEGDLLSRHLFMISDTIAEV